MSLDSNYPDSRAVTHFHSCLVSVTRWLVVAEVLTCIESRGILGCKGISVFRVGLTQSRKHFRN
jgi:hypothetical protein